MAEIRRIGVVVAGGSLEWLMDPTAKYSSPSSSTARPGIHPQNATSGHRRYAPGGKVSLIQIPAVRQKKSRSRHIMVREDV